VYVKSKVKGREVAVAVVEVEVEAVEAGPWSLPVAKMITRVARSATVIIVVPLQATASAKIAVGQDITPRQTCPVP
jgi:hypothetical protein